MALFYEGIPMGTLAQILARLDRLEARLAQPATVDRSAEQVMAQLNLIAGRRREQPGYRPCGVSVATLIEAARNAAARCA
jgi:hypothetical protein